MWLWFRSHRKTSLRDRTFDFRVFNLSKHKNGSGWMSDALGGLGSTLDLGTFGDVSEPWFWDTYLETHISLGIDRPVLGPRRFGARARLWRLWHARQGGSISVTEETERLANVIKDFWPLKSGAHNILVWCFLQSEKQGEGKRPRESRPGTPGQAEYKKRPTSTLWHPPRQTLLRGIYEFSPNSILTFLFCPKKWRKRANLSRADVNAREKETNRYRKQTKTIAPCQE